MFEFSSSKSMIWCGLTDAQILLIFYFLYTRKLSWLWLTSIASSRWNESTYILPYILFSFIEIFYPKFNFFFDNLMIKNQLEITIYNTLIWRLNTWQSSLPLSESQFFETLSKNLHSIIIPKPIWKTNS